MTSDPSHETWLARLRLFREQSQLFREQPQSLAFSFPIELAVGKSHGIVSPQVRHEVALTVPAASDSLALPFCVGADTRARFGSGTGPEEADFPSAKSWCRGLHPHSETLRERFRGTYCTGSGCVKHTSGWPCLGSGLLTTVGVVPDHGGALPNHCAISSSRRRRADWPQWGQTAPLRAMTAPASKVLSCQELDPRLGWHPRASGRRRRSCLSRGAAHDRRELPGSRPTAVTPPRAPV